MCARKCAFHSPNFTKRTIANKLLRPLRLKSNENVENTHIVCVRSEFMRVAFNAPIFTKLANAQPHCVEICCIAFDPDYLRNVKSMLSLLFTPQVKYDHNAVGSQESHTCARQLLVSCIPIFMKIRELFDSLMLDPKTRTANVLS